MDKFVCTALIILRVITIGYSCDLGISQNENGYISTFLEGGYSYDFGKVPYFGHPIF